MPYLRCSGWYLRMPKIKCLVSFGFLGYPHLNSRPDRGCSVHSQAGHLRTSPTVLNSCYWTQEFQPINLAFCFVFPLFLIPFHSSRWSQGAEYHRILREKYLKNRKLAGFSTMKGSEMAKMSAN